MCIEKAHQPYVAAPRLNILIWSDLMKLMKFVTFRTYDDEDPQVLHVSDFTSDWDFSEWVWHLAPSSDGALARHNEAMQAWEEGRVEYYFLHDLYRSRAALDATDNT